MCLSSQESNLKSGHKFCVLKGDEPCLTQRGNKVFMGTQGLHAAFVLVVPDPKGFVISTAHYESSSRMNQYPAHPVVMSNLKKHV